jgi:hypothetical protein
MKGFDLSKKFIVLFTISVFSNLLKNIKTTNRTITKKYSKKKNGISSMKRAKSFTEETKSSMKYNNKCEKK